MTSPRKSKARPIALLLAVALAVAPLNGCAIFFQRNRPTFNMVEEHVVPKSDGMVLATLPLTVPLGLIALFIDQFVVRPFTIVDDAAEDVYDIFWKNVNWDDHYLEEVFWSPWYTVGTAIVFPLDLVFRFFFDFEALDGAPPQDSPVDETTKVDVSPPLEGYRAAFDTAIAQGDIDSAIQALRNIAGEDDKLVPGYYAQLLNGPDGTVRTVDPVVAARVVNERIWSDGGLIYLVDAAPQWRDLMNHPNPSVRFAVVDRVVSDIESRMPNPAGQERAALSERANDPAELPVIRFRARQVPALP